MKCISKNSVGPARHTGRPARTFARSLTVVAIASQAACFTVSPTYEDGFLMEKIDRQYAVRDGCLRREVARIDDGVTDIHALGNQISQACGTENRDLVALINPRRDPQVTARIAEDSAAKASGYVLKARRAKTTSDR